MAGRQRFRSQRGFVNQLLARQLNGRTVLSKPYLEDFSNDAAFGGGTIKINPGGMPSPPFTVRYNMVSSFNQGKWIAIGDEEGQVSIVDGTAELPQELAPSMPGVQRATAQWVAHHNAIFDLAWFQDDERMLTGSGDQCVHLWDTASARGVGQFRGHNGSVKSVCPHATNRNVFASGARDGAMMVWDVRCPAIMCNRSHTAYQAPVLAVQDAHKDVGALKGAKGRRRKYGPFETKHTVTSVVFLHSDYLLATAGDRDDVVKFWDMRRIMEPSLHLTLPKHLPSSDFLLPTEASECVARTPSQNLGKRQHGVTCLALSRQGTRLLVSCNSATHHMYDAQRPDAQPLASFSGHRNGSFYIRACFSPDGHHILSGSSDEKAHIWAVDEPHRPPVVLDGADGEVTGVAWCATDAGQIVTCHDHAAVKVWALDRNRIKEPPAQRQQAVIGGASIADAAATVAIRAAPAIPITLDDDIVMEEAAAEELLEEAGAGPVHPWAARVRAAAGGRAPLGELRGGFWEASQQSRERGETDPIDFSLLQDMENSRGLGDLSQHFEATQQGPLQERGPPPPRFEDPRASQGNNEGADGNLITNAAGGRAPAQTPPERLLRNASALCRERLSAPASPGPQPPPVAESPRSDAAVMIGREGVPKGMSLMPPDEATMASALSVWKGQKKPLCDFLLSEYRNQPVARAVEGGTPPHRRAGPFPEDGFTDESPAPVAPPQPLTPHPQKAMQEELAQAAKRKAGNASARKQRSILDFFKTPPSEQGPKRRKENTDNRLEEACKQ
ncbi:hypothetical protein WJX75_009187 [Coccomyxa subellipsoidea]|uniref:WD40 repeat-like protein n=1 Tax=Coccomyxa subellipsoidea TaxID=248742 RepID=A0ABR2YT35_9CHLO